MSITIHYHKISALLLLHILLCVAAFFTSTVPFSGDLAIVSTLFVIALFVPVAAALWKWLPTKKFFLLIVAIFILAIGIESSALLTGIPYGAFLYNTKTGLLLFNLVPATVPFAWGTILLGCLTLASARTTTVLKRLVLTVLLMVSVDLLLDPVSVSLGLWYWLKPGIYYGIPLVNYIGWVISGAVGAGIVVFITKRFTLPPPQLAIGLYFSIIFWLAIAFLKGLVLPFIAGVLILMLFHKQFSNALKYFYV